MSYAVVNTETGEMIVEDIVKILLTSLEDNAYNEEKYGSCISGLCEDRDILRGLGIPEIVLDKAQSAGYQRAREEQYNKNKKYCS